MKYTTITLLDMLEFFRSNWNSTFDFNYSITRDDHVFTYEITSDIVLKVSISSSDSSNSNAIRVSVINTLKNINWIRSTQVLIVDGWRTNLHRAIINTIQHATIRYNRLSQALTGVNYV